MTLDEEDKIEEETPLNDENNTNACRWQDVPLIPQLVGTVSPCSWYSEKDGCIYSWGGQSGGEEASREEMKVLDLVGACVSFVFSAFARLYLRLLTFFMLFLFIIALPTTGVLIRAVDVSRGKQPEPGRVSVVLRERIEDEQP